MKDTNKIVEFKISSSILNKNLNRVSAVLVSNPLIPILRNFLFEITQDSLKVTASDMQTSVTVTLPIQFLNTKRHLLDPEKAIEIAVPSRMLVDTVKYIPEQDIIFHIDLNTYSVGITSSNGKYKLVGECGLDFPKMEVVQFDGKEIMPSDMLKSMTSITMATVCKDELKPNICGIYMKFDNLGSTFVSVDGHRLSRYINCVERNDRKENAFTVPRKTMQILNTILSSSDYTTVDMKFTSRYVQFSMGNIILISRLINELFPMYENAIPKDNDKLVIVNRLDLLESLKRAAIFTNKSTKRVSLNISTDKIEVLAEDLDFSNEAREVISCDYSGDDITIDFNIFFFTELVTCLKSDQVELHLSTPSKACLITPNSVDSLDSVLLLVMPMSPQTAQP